MLLLHVRVVERLFVPSGPASADDAKRRFVLLGQDDEDDPSGDGSDGNEALLGIRMGIVEYLEVVATRREQLSRLLERDTVLLLIREILGFVPPDLHACTLRQ